MSATVKLSTKLPADEDTNGLDALAGKLVEHPEEIRLAVVWLDVSKITVDTDTGSHIPTVRVRRIEPIGDVGAVSDAVRQIVDHAQEERTGRRPLPFDVIEVEDQTGQGTL